jgi:hypothetical protein
VVKVPGPLGQLLLAGLHPSKRAVAHAKAAGALDGFWVVTGALEGAMEVSCCLETVTN